MPISLQCPNCENECEVEDKLAGRKIRCPECDKVLTVPDEKVEPPSRKRRPEGEKKRRRKKAKQKSNNTVLFVGLGVLGVVVVGSVIAFIVLRKSGIVANNPIANLPGVAAVAGIADSPNATEDNFDKIKSGMTRDEIEKILGPGEKVSRAEVFYALHNPLPPGGVGEDTLTLRWKNKNETILLELLSPKATLMAGWFVRDQGGAGPKYKLLGFGKLK